MGFLFFILAIFLFVPLTLINIVLVWLRHRSLKSIDGYFYQTAIDLDHFGNRNFRTLWNKTLITKEGHQFGDFRETISSVLGKNQRTNTTTKLGKLLILSIDSLDENHCENNIIEF